MGEKIGVGSQGESSLMAVISSMRNDKVKLEKAMDVTGPINSRNVVLWTTTLPMKLDPPQSRR